MPRKPILVYIDDETRKVLDRLSKEEDRSVSQVARRIIEANLPKKKS